MSEELPNARSGSLAAGQYHGQGRYELKRLLGEGGMGQVWLAWDKRLNEEVALKFLPPEIRNDAVALDDMRRETLKSRKLSHPNIVRIHDLHEGVGELPFISMEFVDGANLAALRVEQASRFFTWDFLKPLVKQLCEALDYAHAEGVIHRDLKPGNMMLDRKGRLKLADFGIAATINDSSNRVSVKNPTAGTLAYMSPQHLRGEIPKAADDIYALGATLYELLTSTPPFFTGDIVHQIEAVPVKPLEERLWELGMENPVPPDVAALILACLAKDPAQRPPSAGAVAEWIGLGGATSRQPKTLLESATDPVQTEENEKSKVAAPAKGKHGLILLTVAIVVVMAILAVVWRKKPKDQPVNIVENVAAPTETVATVTQPPALTPEELKAATQPHNGSGRHTPGFPTEAGANGPIHSAMLLPNGQFLISGRFTEFNGRSYNRVALLNPNASYNPTFNPGAGPDREVSHALAQPDGKVLIAGPFETVNDIARAGIARLNADGSLDTTFNPGTGANKAGHRMWLQADGKIILAGYFTQFNGQPRNYLVRLLPDGAVDPGFNATGGPNDPVLALCQTPDGRLWIGGEFSRVGNQDSPRLAALDPNGNLAGTSNVDGPVQALTTLADGSVMVGGTFSRILGVERRNLARLKAPDMLDATFKTDTGCDHTVCCIAQLPDGSLLVGGDFNRVDGQIRRGLARLNRDGSLNAAMDARLGGAAAVRSIMLQISGGVVVAGDLSAPGAAGNTGMARIIGATPVPGKVTETKAITMAAHSTWFDTGFNVLKDSTYEILATGAIKLSDGSELSPDGLLERPYDTDIGPQGKPGNDPAHPGRSLIAQIGDTKLTLFIGSHQRFIAPYSGRLKLRCNLNPGELAQTTGQFHVTMRRLDSLFFTEPDWRFEIAARIDSADELHLRFGSAKWEHRAGGARVGRHNGMNLPTILNGFCWWPEWEGDVTQPVRAPGLLYPYNKWGLKVWQVINGRGTCTITQQTFGKGPGGGADSAVLNFKDGGTGSKTIRVLIGPDR
jgi:uncharacterized delta-60 repeat protein